MHNEFRSPCKSIAEIHLQTHAAASKAVNISLTCRNWLIGAYIHEYELHGQDRAEYSEKLFARLASTLTAGGTPNCNKSRLYRYRDFYRLYPHIVATLPPQFQNLLGFDETPTDDLKVATLSPQSYERVVGVMQPIAGHVILERLSYSHIEPGSHSGHTPVTLRKSLWEWGARQLYNTAEKPPQQT